MQANTLSIVVGGEACNAHCPYCVSKMTPAMSGVRGKLMTIPTKHNFRTAYRAAICMGAHTVLLTSKGEPTLFPEQITECVGTIKAMEMHDRIPFLELQTNGIELVRRDNFAGWLKDWCWCGMTHVCISIAHYDSDRNAEIFSPDEEYCFWKAVDVAHAANMTVRLNCILLKGYIDKPMAFAALVDECRRRGIEQLTARSVARPEFSRDAAIGHWVESHIVPGIEDALRKHMMESGAIELLRLSHGATVYDWQGQNVCVSTCLTRTPDPDNIRQLIFNCGDGHLYYDWEYKGAILL